MSVPSDADMTRECNKLRDELKKENDWEKRSVALIRLGGLAKGVLAGGEGHGGLASSLKAMRRELMDNILDLRSSIVRDTSTSLMICSWALGMDFEIVFDFLLEGLLKQIVVSIAVVKDSAHECVLECLRATPTTRVLEKLIESAHSKSVLQRLRTSEYFLAIMKSWPQHVLERVMPKLTDVLRKKVLADADSQVKLNGRLCVKEMLVRVPDEGASFIESLDQSTQRLLQDVLVNSQVSSGEMSQLSRLSAGSSNDQATATRAAQRSLSATNNLSTAVATALGDSVSDDATTSSSSQGFNSSRTPSSGRRDPGTDRSLPSISEKRERVRSDQLARRGFGYQPSASTTASHEQHHQADSHSVSPPRFPRSSSKSTPGKALVDAAASAHVTHTTHLNPQTAQSARPRLPLKEMSAVSTSNDTARSEPAHHNNYNNNANTNSYQQQQQQQHHVRKDTSPVPSHHKAVTAQDSANKFTKSSVRPQMRVARTVEDEKPLSPSPEPVPLDITTALAIIESDSPWKDKESALNHLLDEPDSAIRRNASQVTSAIWASLTSQHFKVQSAAIKCFCALLRRRHVEMFSVIIADIFAVLLNMSLGSNTAFRKEGETAMYTTLDTSAPSDTVPALTSTLRRAVLDHNEPIVVNGLRQLNYALSLDECSRELTKDSQLAVLLPILAACVSPMQRNGDIKTWACDALRDLRAINETALIAAMKACPADAKTSLMTCAPVADIAPNPNSPPRRHLADSAPAPAPTPVSVSVAASSVPAPTALGRSGSSLKAEAKQGLARTASESTRTAKKDDLQDLVKEVVAKARGGRDTRQQALRKMFQWTKDERVASVVWAGSNVHDLSLALLEMFPAVAGDPDHEFIRDHAIAVFESLLENHPKALPVDFHRPLLLRLLEAHNDSMREAASTCLVKLLGVMDPHVCLEELVPIIDAEEGPVLQASVFSLKTILPRFSANETLNLLPRFLPGVLRAFRSKSADVRKAVVYCLVKLHGLIGDALMPHLSELNPTQLRLVQVYIERQE